MINQLLTILILIPILGFVACAFTSKASERLIFNIAITTILFEGLMFLFLVYLWFGIGASPVSLALGSLYSGHHFTFTLDFFFDKLSAVFLGTTTVITALVFIFSKPYLHREDGFKRFYCTVLLFFIGLLLIMLAGNFEILLLGWEIIGITSVLLIAFYRDRYLPGKNALKVYSVYRIADAFLLLAIWYAHHIFDGSVHFSELSQLVAGHGGQLALLGLLLLITASIKSAQFPFSYWLPRAMEGPTNSSAIFYGALSVHIGLFLLLRTYPLWEGNLGLRLVTAIIGLITAIIASSITRVQSSIKMQITYASITQIGIMFIEAAAGLPWLVMLHFISNASLRTYQLLISPSIVGYLVHDQFFSVVPSPQRIKNTLLGRFRATVYILGIKEWNMDTLSSHYVWQSLKSIGRRFTFLDRLQTQVVAVALLLALAGITIHPELSNAISITAAVVSLIFYIRAYSTKDSARICWNLLMLGNLFGAFYLGLITNGNWNLVVKYSLGFGIAFIVGHACLWYMHQRGESLILREYNGNMYVFKKLGYIFFFACLLFMTFPISPSFLAQDILLSQVSSSNFLQITLFYLGYVIMGISIMRLYMKLFFGPYKSNYSEIAYKSS